MIYVLGWVNPAFYVFSCLSTFLHTLYLSLFGIWFTVPKSTVLFTQTMISRSLHYAVLVSHWPIHRERKKYIHSTRWNVYSLSYQACLAITTKQVLGELIPSAVYRVSEVDWHFDFGSTPLIGPWKGVGGPPRGFPPTFPESSWLHPFGPPSCKKWKVALVLFLSFFLLLLSTTLPHPFSFFVLT